ncbi:aldo/keto reductase [Maribacter sp. PR1]|uniref:Aldo/keto reductase n=1 Tax=Maribacter cobaltidurans TaxID=1178778 RepID=A0ABU7IZW7_9FLAO|nr:MULTISPECIES: aldo/keto reductase [Maribacter]MDC6391012.1 aldo/keto reductase [Maribacter sp. PR1]MEE1978404.1 aldo/keto reductase [Maribacter cobaltidurans]
MKITDINAGFELRNGVTMPYLGLGTYQAENNQEVIDSVKYALEIGYRHIDTASVYENEEGVGKGIKESSVAREDVFLVTKVWNSDQGYDSTLKSFEDSINRLQVDYLDLILVHWPVQEKYKETWKALEYLYENKKVRAIGVSNFLQHHLEDLMMDCKIIPMVNQMEFHPYLVQQELLDFCNKNTIQYEAWSPFMQGKLFNLDICKELTAKYNKSAAQIILRWNLQKGVVTIPKSVHKNRIASNADIFDFELAEDDVAYLDSLDRDERSGPHPDHFDF